MKSNKEEIKDSLLKEILKTKFNDFEYKENLIIDISAVLKENNRGLSSFRTYYWIGGLAILAFLIYFGTINTHKEEKEIQKIEPSRRTKIIIETKSKAIEVKKEQTSQSDSLNSSIDTVKQEVVTTVVDVPKTSKKMKSSGRKKSSFKKDSILLEGKIIDKSTTAHEKKKDFKSFMQSYTESSDSLQLFIK